MKLFTFFRIFFILVKLGVIILRNVDFIWKMTCHGASGQEYGQCGCACWFGLIILNVKCHKGVIKLY